jgi:hypothetical protein
MPLFLSAVRFHQQPRIHHSPVLIFSYRISGVLMKRYWGLSTDSNNLFICFIPHVLLTPALAKLCDKFLSQSLKAGHGSLLSPQLSSISFSSIFSFHQQLLNFAYCWYSGVGDWFLLPGLTGQKFIHVLAISIHVYLLLTIYLYQSSSYFSPKSQAELDKTNIRFNRLPVEVNFVWCKKNKHNAI